METPHGPGWHRYSHDGYGQKANGDPYDGTGVGRLWPLLTGERGHYEIAAGRTAYKYIRTMEAFASDCALIPEQVWDAEDIPAKHMFIGRPTGSAMPLVWSHAEYIKLLRSARDGMVFDLIAPVRKRYIDDRATTDVQVWTFKQKLREFDRERPLASKFMPRRACTGVRTTGQLWKIPRCRTQAWAFMCMNSEGGARARRHPQVYFLLASGPTMGRTKFQSGSSSRRVVAAAPRAKIERRGECG